MSASSSQRIQTWRKVKGKKRKLFLYNTLFWPRLSQITSYPSSQVEIQDGKNFDSHNFKQLNKALLVEKEVICEVFKWWNKDDFRVEVYEELEMTNNSFIKKDSAINHSCSSPTSNTFFNWGPERKLQNIDMNKSS